MYWCTVWSTSKLRNHRLCEGPPRRSEPAPSHHRVFKSITIDKRGPLFFGYVFTSGVRKQSIISSEDDKFLRMMYRSWKGTQWIKMVLWFYFSYLTVNLKENYSWLHEVMTCTEDLKDKISHWTSISNVCRYWVSWRSNGR